MRQQPNKGGRYHHSALPIRCLQWPASPGQERPGARTCCWPTIGLMFVIGEQGFQAIHSFSNWGIPPAIRIGRLPGLVKQRTATMSVQLNLSYSENSRGIIVYQCMFGKPAYFAGDLPEEWMYSSGHAHKIIQTFFQSFLFYIYVQ